MTTFFKNESLEIFRPFSSGQNEMNLMCIVLFVIIHYYKYHSVPSTIHQNIVIAVGATISYVNIFYSRFLIGDREKKNKSRPSVRKEKMAHCLMKCGVVDISISCHVTKTFTSLVVQHARDIVDPFTLKLMNNMSTKMKEGGKIAPICDTCSTFLRIEVSMFPIFHYFNIWCSQR